MFNCSAPAPTSHHSPLGSGGSRPTFPAVCSGSGTLAAGSAMAWEKGSVGRSKGGQFLEVLKSLRCFPTAQEAPSCVLSQTVTPGRTDGPRLRQKGFRGLCLRGQGEAHLEFQEIHWSEVVPAPVDVRPTGLW